MQWTGIYSLHTAMRALRPGGGGGRGGEKVVRILLLQKSCACALQLPALPPPTPTIYMETSQSTRLTYTLRGCKIPVPVLVPVSQHWYRY